MENICIKILQILPKLEPNTLDSLMKRLEDIGVVAAENDLKYVQESDITTIIRPIEARKVINAW
ncbi:unnamed protein product [Larinioides sclopetarius]|uniref:Uncharacterized protein n=1 Tax=Larinioides sclopetarius TaxID=280406 RepID=A0AAV1ZV96_9ARAC